MTSWWGDITGALARLAVCFCENCMHVSIKPVGFLCKISYVRCIYKSFMQAYLKHSVPAV